MKENWFRKVGRKVKEEVADYALLFKSIPWWITLMFVMSVVFMNIFANKVMFRAGNFLAGDCGVLLSWIPFLAMDMVVKRYGPKAATKMNILALLINLVCVAIFAGVVAIPGDGEDYSAFNATLGSSWFIVFGSSLAFVLSGVVNNFSNFAIGKVFKKNPDGKLAYVCRSYISTFIGQFVDNVIFAIVVFVIFGPIYWEGFTPFTAGLVIGTGVMGALTELLMEVIFSPIGYKISKKWKEQGIGKEYLDKHPELEV